MSRHKRRRRALALAAVSLAAAPLAALGQTPVLPPNTPNSNIFDPGQAPVIVLQIGVRRYVLVPKATGSETTISGKSLEQKGITTFSQAITQNVAGAAAAPSGEIHIRGSHGQYTYYLDGAPLPSNINGSFSDLIDPKDIESLKVLDGGFPAEYGGQLAAIFDVTTRGGHGTPNGLVQQLDQGYNTYQTTAEVGGSESRLSYFFSGVRHSSDLYLSPVSQTPLHDSGLDNIGFGKVVFTPGIEDRVTLDVSASGAQEQIPNTPDRQAVGENDIQQETSQFANLIWRHGIGPDSLNLALYSHNSHLRYIGGPNDLVAGPPGSPSADASTLDETFQDQGGDYVGLRLDKKQQVDPRNEMQYGFDVDRATGHENFQDYGADLVNDKYDFTGGDRSAYLQDDWTPGRFLVNYGARYDVHQADITTSQLSPRLNVVYHLSGRDDAHAYYDRLFQPVPIEDVINLTEAQGKPFQPERDDFVEFGVAHRQGGATISLDTYYRAEKNTVDDATFANTQIDIPENFAKGYTRGVEFSVDGPLVKTVSYYANFARSWAQEAGPVSGGLLAAAPSTYFYDDHDQTNTASFGVSYNARGVYADIDGEYGSGFPYGEIDDTNGNPVTLDFIRTEPHLTMDATLGGNRGPIGLAFMVNNLFNDGYILKQASAFSELQWAPGRTFGARLTFNF
jgi:hypothetical protein